MNDINIPMIPQWRNDSQNGPIQRMNANGIKSLLSGQSSPNSSGHPVKDEITTPLAWKRSGSEKSRKDFDSMSFNRGSLTPMSGANPLMNDKISQNSSDNTQKELEELLGIKSQPRYQTFFNSYIGSPDQLSQKDCSLKPKSRSNPNLDEDVDTLDNDLILFKI
eukprot:TRINITY_DN11083_c0_g1_i11.p1 TRINITY_DN11083_c0_g1~~TRINITY_DN11083_c0_g1_i11.p1  ORF type:complete len:164 (+),score=27.39 TRINITY_DN11083_c0_g1_i11:642-1133(+)